MKCLTSYERHNQIHCCPICRRRDYEKKVIDEAIRAFTLKSIIRIQRCFRGSRVRIKFYSDLVGKGYVAKSMYFNRRLLGYRLLRLSQKVKDNAKKTQDYLTDMLANI